MRQGESLDKRYQVFISSTFVDLVDERQAVLKAILELDQMPAGMELFPASDDAAWRLIRDVIDASDYYVVIVGGRYGSTDATGLSFTEREYDHAAGAGIPVIPLLHANPEGLPRDRTETTDEAWGRLETFRAKVEARHTCVYWTGAEDLKAKVIVGLTAAMKRHPAIGWVRADQVPTQATIAEVLTLRNRIQQLEAEADASGVKPPPGSEDLEQGDDTVSAKLSFVARESGRYVGGSTYTGDLELRWNELYASVAPTLINEATDEQLREAIRVRFGREGRTKWGDQKQLKDKTLSEFVVRREDLDTCVIQFRALGLIRENVRTRSVRDTNTYWSLTPYGDHLMTQLRALRRVPLPTGGAASPAKSEGGAGRRRKSTRREDPPEAPADSTVQT